MFNMKIFKMNKNAQTNLFAYDHFIVGTEMQKYSLKN